MTSLILHLDSPAQAMAQESIAKAGLFLCHNEVNVCLNFGKISINWTEFGHNSSGLHPKEVFLNK